MTAAGNRDNRGVINTFPGPDALAIVQRGYGPSDVLSVERMPVLPLVPGEIRVRTIASAVNFSDLQIRAGRWPIRRPDPFPYVPGLEVVGVVVEVGPDVTDWRVGDVAITLMQGMGGVRAERPGGYAELVTMPADVAAPVPAGLDPLIAATVGLAGVTAYSGLQRLGPLAGATVVVTGATGGVGSTALRIAAALGAQPVAVVSRPGSHDGLINFGAVRVVAAAALTEDLPPGSVDGVLDTVAGPVFAPVVAALRPRGRYCLVGGAAGGTVTWNAYGLLDGIVLTGWSSEGLDGPALRAVWRSVSDLLSDGRLVAPEPTVLPLTEAARAHDLLESRAVTGRLLLTPA